MIVILSVRVTLALYTLHISFKLRFLLPHGLKAQQRSERIPQCGAPATQQRINAAARTISFKQRRSNAATHPSVRRTSDTATQRRMAVHNVWLRDCTMRQAARNDFYTEFGYATAWDPEKLIDPTGWWFYSSMKDSWWYLENDKIEEYGMNAPHDGRFGDDGKGASKGTGQSSGGDENQHEHLEGPLFLELSRLERNLEKDLKQVTELKRKSKFLYQQQIKSLSRIDRCNASAAGSSTDQVRPSRASPRRPRGRKRGNKGDGKTADADAVPKDDTTVNTEAEEDPDDATAATAATDQTQKRKRKSALRGP